MFYLLVYQHLILYHFSFVINRLLNTHIHNTWMQHAMYLTLQNRCSSADSNHWQHLNSLSKTMSRFQKATAHHQGENFDICPL